MSLEINKITTESKLETSYNIDKMSTIDILKVINEEDKKVPFHVEKAIPDIAILVDECVKAIENGGRVIYMGAGTSGRIGLLDAAECPPTYGVKDDEIMCLLAGGKNAFTKAVEGAEDSVDLAIEDLKNINVNEKDIIIGIAASGRTPYVIGGIEFAKSKNCKTACIVNSLNSPIASVVDIKVEVVTGSEVISGSTRMKSGTSQKLVCNMISTSTMIKLGHVYHNQMIDVLATNEKLIARQINIIKEITGYDIDQAKDKLNKFKTVKNVIFNSITNIEDLDIIENTLKKHKYNIQKALKEYYND